MNNEYVEKMTAQTETMMAPARELSALMVANLEKLASLQLASLEAYYNMGLSSMKAALEVKDVESLKDYTAKQGEMMKAVGEKVTADAKAVAELSGEFNAEAQKIAREAVNSLSKVAA